ncbi:ankyrin [Aspergillus violaceofuscus CBS 115571]|uniref:Ankyrin n=2 Tax=Aspergillus TaxID=5052 RepID=A0A2V5HHT8_ASPV1|nr:ankyrin [Aspergillus violaceofuscus CBS 115571]
MAEQGTSAVATPKPATFLTIPPELHLHIIKLLDATSLVRLGLSLPTGYGFIWTEIQKRARSGALPSQELYDKRISYGDDGELQIHRFAGDAEWRRSIREPLAEAVCTGDFEVVKFFLAAGVSANSIDLDAVPMLHLSFRQCQYHITELLLQHNADPNVVRPTTGQMALDYAVGGPRGSPNWVLEMLLAAGARFVHDSTFIICCTQSWGPAFFRLAAKNGAEILPKAPDCDFRLQAAYKLARVEVIDCLFDLRPNLVAARHKGLSALDMALMYGREDVAVSLVRRGTPLDTSAEKQLTLAMRYGHTKLVRELLRHGQLAEQCPRCKCAAIDLSEEHRREASRMTSSRQRWLQMIS